MIRTEKAGVTRAQIARYKNSDPRISRETRVACGTKHRVLMELISRRISRADPSQRGSSGTCVRMCLCYMQHVWLDAAVLRGGGNPVERAATLPRSP